MLEAADKLEERFQEILSEFYMEKFLLFAPELVEKIGAKIIEKSGESQEE